MSNNIYNTEIHNVCLQCQLQNEVIAEDVANNNWDEKKLWYIDIRALYTSTTGTVWIHRDYSYNHDPNVPYPH